MNRNRLIQVVSILVAVVCIGGASAITPLINEQRERLFDNQLVENLPPEYALLAAMGSFRGLAVDALWYRAEMLKREGKFFDAKALRDLIVTLQPRFPQVWRYQAWDMAYNISVATHTPEERWDWVSKGIRLLRDQGIPHNPTSVELYREIAWIYFHKVGGYSDDMHWYYKAQVAQEWQELLGAPSEGVAAERAIAEFAAIADAAERYLTFDRPSREVRQRLEALAEANEDIADQLHRIGSLSLVRFVNEATRLRRQFERDRPAVARELAALIEQSNQRLSRAQRDPLTLLYADAPAAQPVVAALRDAGLDIDVNTLRRMGRLQMFIRYAGVDALRARAAEVLDDADRTLLDIITDPQHQQGLRQLLPFLRARVILNDYNMDPVAMHRVMDRYGPLDWRHPAAHGLYWSDKGLEKAGLVRDRSKIDWLNTTRQRIHNIQELTRFGRVNYNPFTQQVDLMPDTRFVEFYEKAMYEGIAAAEQYQWQGDGNVDSFESGHENYLLMAMVYEYIFGREARARELQERARSLYASRPHNLHSGRYQLTLRDQVMTELETDWDMQNMARALVTSLLQRGFIEGLAEGDTAVFNRFVEDARAIHARYQQRRHVGMAHTPRDRLLMLPFDQTVAESYIGFMQSPEFHPLGKSQVFRNTSPRLQHATYLRFREAVRQQAEAFDLDFDRAFPRPPGLREDIELRDLRDDLPTTIERR
jgi:hypothetical protein